MHEDRLAAQIGWLSPTCPVGTRPHGGLRHAHVAVVTGVPQFCCRWRHPLGHSHTPPFLCASNRPPPPSRPGNISSAVTGSHLALKTGCGPWGPLKQPQLKPERFVNTAWTGQDMTSRQREGGVCKQSQSCRGVFCPVTDTNWELVMEFHSSEHMRCWRLTQSCQGECEVPEKTLRVNVLQLSDANRAPALMRSGATMSKHFSTVMECSWRRLFSGVFQSLVTNKGWEMIRLFKLRFS